MKLKGYIKNLNFELNSLPEFIQIPACNIYTNYKDDISSLGASDDDFNNVLNKYDLVYADNGLEITTRLPNSYTEEEYLIWESMNPVFEILGGDGETVWWDRGQIEMSRSGKSHFKKI